MRQSACLVVNVIRVYSYGFLFNCMTMGQASDTMMVLTVSLIGWLVPDACFGLGPPWFNLKFYLAQTICES